jgi:CheY-like chemotaxis protein
MRSGFQSHLSKPVEPTELLNVVERLARQSPPGAPAQLKKAGL